MICTPHKQASLLLTTLVLSGISSYHITLASPSTRANNLVIVFDIDDVLVELPKGARWDAIWNEKGTIAKNFWRPSVIRRIRKLTKKRSCSEEILHEFERAKKPDIARLIRRIAHAKVPVQGMAALLRELKNLGYTIHILSNMGRSDFNFYKQKYPGIFSLIDEALVVDYVPGIKIIKKPDPAFFDLYRAQFPTSKQHLFIDDKQANCAASGFADTIVFANATQLRSELIARNIL